jgi:thiol-disulfide isomerase/thioredoxin
LWNEFTPEQTHDKIREVIN